MHECFPLKPQSVLRSASRAKGARRWLYCPVEGDRSQSPRGSELPEKPAIRGILAFTQGRLAFELPRLFRSDGHPVSAIEIINRNKTIMQLKNLKDLLVHEIMDLYDAEHRIEKALKKMASKTESEQARKLFEEHCEQTRGHIERLEKIFSQLDEKPRRVTCKGTQGLIEEAEELMKESKDAATCDAGLIASAQKVEHYEMAGYGTARTWARALGYDECCDLLQATLDEEGATDKKLTDAAERLNPRATT